MSDQYEPGGRKKDPMRLAILAAAQQLFASEIAARAGSTRRWFRYFGNQDKPFGASIADRGRRVLEAGPAEALLGYLLVRARTDWLCGTVTLTTGRT